MFYSHTFLAKKGPLGTVWCAAHLQHRLKKSHYNSTDIPRTVERIMYPEVPIALRMSGHLLLGVVRIYSKKVDYLYQDCNSALTDIRKAFTSVNVNLPEGATQAPFEAITIPDTFQLDALDLDDNLDMKGFQDYHLKNQDEIILTDQIPTGRDVHIVITLDEVVLRDSLRSENAPVSGDTPMEEDVHPSVPGSATAFRDSSPNNPSGLNEQPNRASTQSFPEIEIMRDAFRDVPMDDVPLWPDQGNDVLEPDRVLEQQILNQKDTVSPVEEMLDSNVHSVPFEQHQEPPSATPGQIPGIFHFGHASPELALRSSPPAEQPNQMVVPPAEQQNRRRRKRKHFDKSTVLTNNYMKKALEYSSDLLRVKKQCPCSALDVWKLNNRLKKDKIFLDPLMTGFPFDLCNIYSKEFISAKVHLVAQEETHPENGVTKSLGLVVDTDMEIEHLRNCEGPSNQVHSPHRLEPSPTRFVMSPTRPDDFTPASPTNWGSQMDLGERTFETGGLPTTDLRTSTGYPDSGIETPMTFSGQHFDVENTVLSDIPELDSGGELNFLELDDNASIGPEGTPEGTFNRKDNLTPRFDSLSARTRAVAQYLKRQSSVTPTSELSSGDLSLNKILGGKRKKICARMFFEALVLKNCGLLDVQQDIPYGDIALKVTPKLSKEQFSS